MIEEFIRKIKPYFKAIKWIALVLILVGLIITSASYYGKYVKLKESYSVSMNNIKAYSAENSTLKRDNIVMKFTVEQLNYYNDSINDKLNKARQALKIKDKEIESLQYYRENFTKTDTITLGPDTIFVKDLHIDTVIVDTFYTCRVKLDYPNRVILNPNFINEKMIFVSSVKETINPPKKYWIKRIFQKKHIVLTIDVIDSNPFVTTSQSRFIKIIE